MEDTAASDLWEVGNKVLLVPEKDASMPLSVELSVTAINTSKSISQSINLRLIGTSRQILVGREVHCRFDRSNM